MGLPDKLLEEIAMLNRQDLTHEELRFLVAHKIHFENLYDARGQAPTSWNEEAKALGCDFGLSEPCYRGHRLRDRKGHCIQCATSNIAYMRRASANGFVYIAASKKGQIYKVGSTIDFKQRVQALRRDKYAGLDDWKIICVCRVKNSGRIEFEIHKKLTEYKELRTYEVSGKKVTATEAFKASLTIVWQGFQTSVSWGDLPENKKSRAKNFAAFDYSK